MRNLHSKLSSRFVLLVAGFSVLVTSAASQVRQDTLHLRNWDTGNQVIQDDRGGIAAIGTATKYSSTWVPGHSGLWIAASSPGTPTVKVTTTSNSDEYINGSSLVATHELDGFIAVGSRLVSGSTDTVVMRIDSAGSSVWSQVLRFGSENSEAQHVIQVTNDRYAVVGTNGADLLAFLIDGNGTVMQSVTVGGPGIEYGQRIAVDPSTGEIVAIGSSRDDLVGQVDLFAVAFDADLNYVDSNRTKTPATTALIGVDIIPGANGQHVVLASDDELASAYLIFTSGITPTTAVNISSPLRDLKPGSILRLPSGGLRICGTTDIRSAIVATDSLGTVISGRQFQSDSSLKSIIDHPNGTNLVMVGAIPVGTNLSDAYFVTAGLLGGSCASRGFVVNSSSATTFTTQYGSSSLVTDQIVGSLSLTTRGTFSNLCP